MLYVVCPERFWSKVDKRGENECWEWLAQKNEDGYGRMCQTGKRSRRQPVVTAHRVSWQLENGEIPEGMQILHKCDNPSCVNPAHLFVGTQPDNIADMCSKRRNRGAVGEVNWCAVLSDEIVQRIRYFHKHRLMTRPAMAKSVGVSLGCLDKAIYRETWRHVPAIDESSHTVQA